MTSRFDPQKKTKILAHGFTSNGMDDFVTGTTEAYLGTIHKGRPQNFWDFGPLPPILSVDLTIWSISQMKYCEAKMVRPTRVVEYTVITPLDLNGIA